VLAKTCLSSGNELILCSRRLTVSVYSCVLRCLFLLLWESTTQSLCVGLEGRRNSCLFSTRHQDL